GIRALTGVTLKNHLKGRNHNLIIIRNEVTVWKLLKPSG
ncbi:hypothetical protein TNCV_2495401, partial [Trichonephila clavipes]